MILQNAETERAVIIDKNKSIDKRMRLVDASLFIMGRIEYEIGR